MSDDWFCGIASQHIIIDYILFAFLPKVPHGFSLCSGGISDVLRIHFVQDSDTWFFKNPQFKEKIVGVVSLELKHVFSLHWLTLRPYENSWLRDVGEISS